MPDKDAKIVDLRRTYHERLCDEIIRIRKRSEKEYPNFADGSSTSSVAIARSISNQLKCSKSHESITGQTKGKRFEEATSDFLAKCFDVLQHLRPGNWEHSTTETAISEFDQYAHLAHVEQVVQDDETLSSALGRDYIVAPDIVIARFPVEDVEINNSRNGDSRNVVDEQSRAARLTPLRAANHDDDDPRLLLHASISCKWTIRSDRSQNTRTEALNLVRNRKGHLPHIAAVTIEPMPTRLAALAMGTGDLDCIYHAALPELRKAIEGIDNEDQLDMLNMMEKGRRLRDISDLPFDLAA